MDLASKANAFDETYNELTTIVSNFEEFIIHNQNQDRAYNKLEAVYNRLVSIWAEIPANLKSRLTGQYLVPIKQAEYLIKNRPRGLLATGGGAAGGGFAEVKRKGNTLAQLAARMVGKASAVPGLLSQAALGGSKAPMKMRDPTPIYTEEEEYDLPLVFQNTGLSQFDNWEKGLTGYQGDEPILTHGCAINTLTYLGIYSTNEGNTHIYYMNKDMGTPIESLVEKLRQTLDIPKLTYREFPIQSEQQVKEFLLGNLKRTLNRILTMCPESTFEVSTPVRCVFKNQGSGPGGHTFVMTLTKENKLYYIDPQTNKSKEINESSSAFRLYNKYYSKFQYIIYPKMPISRIRTTLLTTQDICLLPTQESDEFIVEELAKVKPSITRFNIPRIAFFIRIHQRSIGLVPDDFRILKNFVKYQQERYIIRTQTPGHRVAFDCHPGALYEIGLITEEQFMFESQTTTECDLGRYDIHFKTYPNLEKTLDAVYSQFELELKSEKRVGFGSGIVISYGYKMFIATFHGESGNKPGGFHYLGTHYEGNTVQFYEKIKEIDTDTVELTLIFSVKKQKDGKYPQEDLDQIDYTIKIYSDNGWVHQDTYVPGHTLSLGAVNLLNQQYQVTTQYFIYDSQRIIDSGDFIHPDAWGVGNGNGGIKTIDELSAEPTDQQCKAFLQYLDIGSSERNGLFKLFDNMYAMYEFLIKVADVDEFKEASIIYRENKFSMSNDMEGLDIRDFDLFDDYPDDMEGKGEEGGGAGGGYANESPFKMFNPYYK